ncbi:MAG: sialidase family protein [Planctomycetota bacterium]
MRTSFALQTVVSAALLLAVRSGPALGGEEASGKVKLLFSFEKEELEAKGFKLTPWKIGEQDMDGFLVRIGAYYDYPVTPQNATHGKLAFQRFYAHKSDKWKNYPRVMGYFDKEWEKCCQGRQALSFYGATARILGGDWSGYEQLWVDVTSPEADLWLRLIVEDVDDTSPYVRYRAPKGKTCTLVLPLARYAAGNSRPDRGPFVPRRLDLARIVNFTIYLEEAGEEAGQMSIDNIRLAAKDAAVPENAVQPTEEIERDWGWSDLARKHPPVVQPEVKREAGSVEKIGPVTLASGYKEFCSYLGNDGPRYHRAIAAVDNKRIVALVGGQAPLGFASFDGGKTWGGLDGKSDKPTPLSRYSQVAWAGADGLTGNAYITFNSTVNLPKGYAADKLELPAGPDYFDRFMRFSYCMGGGTIRCIGLRNIVFKGDKWDEPGPGAVLDDFARHCIHWGEFVRHPAGRLWAFVDVGSDVLSGISIRGLYSDDNGLTWIRAHKGRYLHEPSGANDTFYAAPYGEGVALVANGRGSGAWWTVFDGKDWSARKVLGWGRDVGISSLVSWGQDAKKPDRLFALLGRGDNLVLARFKDGAWPALDGEPVIDDGAKGKLGFAIASVSGETVCCFWVRDYETGADGVAHSKVLVRRYHIPTGKLGDEEELVTEDKEPISALAVPAVSPPDYVPLLWCNSWFSGWRRYGYKSYGGVKEDWHKKYQQWVKFMRVPNQPG